MDIKNFISQYDINQILKLESQDPQFCALSSARQQIKVLQQDDKILLANFLFLVIQNALVSYQLSGRWENRREEFGHNLSNYFKTSQNLNIETNLAFRTKILKNCKNNCRLNKMKLDRIKKTLKFFGTLNDYQTLKNFYNDMAGLNDFLAQMMKQRKDAKTIVFAVKMFGYWSRIVFGNTITYPFDISIPIDARIIKIYEKNTWEISSSHRQIKEFFDNLSMTYKIPPLHLDTVLRLKYWNLFIFRNKKWNI